MKPQASDGKQKLTKAEVEKQVDPMLLEQKIASCSEEKKIDWLIDSLLFEYGNFISYITSLHESRIETEVNTVQLH